MLNATKAIQHLLGWIGTHFMSTTPDPRTQAQVLEQERRRLSQRLEEVAKLCEAPIPPSAFYSELLQRLLDSLAAPGGCVWVVTPQGNLQQAFQINFQQAALDSEEARAGHDSLLRLAFMNGQPIHLPPRSSIAGEPGQAPPGNPSPHLLMLVPIRQNDQVIGLIEVLQGANRPANAIPGFLQYMNMMADLAGRYQRNQLVGQLVGQQQLWSQLELFTRTAHGSLNPTEVAYHIANEGRRLIECDRVSVIIRPRGERARVEAVSGSDTVEKRSNQVVKLRRLADRVMQWGERLVFSGTRDDTLPPKVLEALDDYIQESPSRLLVLMPLTDEREGDGKDKPKQPSRSALVMECFEAPADEAQTMARLDVVARHASSALYNSMELRRIPFRWIWMPLATLQEGLGGQTRAIVMLVVAAISILIGGLIALPYPLKVDSGGTLLPAARKTIYSPAPGTVKRFEVRPGQILAERTVLAEMFDSDLDSKIRTLMSEIHAANYAEQSARESANIPGISIGERNQALTQAGQQEIVRKAKEAELRELLRRTNSIPNRPGWFNIVAPNLTPSERAVADRPEWLVLNSNFEEMEGREVRPNEPILRLGVTSGKWEVEIKIPQKYIGQVLREYQNNGGQPLRVDFLLLSDTTRVFEGLLHRHRIAGEATASQDAASEAEPVVLATVEIEDASIPEGSNVVEELGRNRLVSGTEIKAKVYCGTHAAGYSLFYGVWEFLYEKVVFFF
jgi:hypothetical protein